MLRQLLVPTAVLELDASATLGCLSNHQDPSFADLVVGRVPLDVVLWRAPSWQGMDDIGRPIEVAQGYRWLRLVGRKEVGGEVAQSFKKVREGLPDSVVRIVGLCVATQGKR